MNITLDFTKANSFTNLMDQQPIAVMPAELAKKLLEMYSKSLANSTNTRIISDHIKLLSGYAEIGNLQGAMDASISWLAERELILNVSHGNWDAYTVSVIQTVHEDDRHLLNQMH